MKKFVFLSVVNLLVFSSTLLQAQYKAPVRAKSGTSALPRSLPKKATPAKPKSMPMAAGRKPTPFFNKAQLPPKKPGAPTAHRPLQPAYSPPGRPPGWARPKPDAPLGSLGSGKPQAGGPRNPWVASGSRNHLPIRASAPIPAPRPVKSTSLLTPVTRVAAPRKSLPNSISLKLQPKAAVPQLSTGKPLPYTIQRSSVADLANNNQLTDGELSSELSAAAGTLVKLRDLKIDPAVQVDYLKSAAYELPGEFDLIGPKTASGPVGNAAPSVGNREYAASERGPNLQEQVEIWRNLGNDTRGDNPTAWHEWNEIRIIRPEDGLQNWYGWTDGHLYLIREEQDTQTGERLYMRRDAHQDGVIKSTVYVDGPNGHHGPPLAGSGDGQTGNYISREESDEGTPKDFSNPLDNTPRGIYASTTTYRSVDNSSSGSSGSSNSDPNSSESSQKDTKNSPPPKEAPPKTEPGPDGGSKDKQPDGEGNGTGVDGRSLKALPMKSDSVEPVHRTQPDSVVQPTGPDDPSFRPKVKALPGQGTPPRVGGYIWVAPKKAGGKNIASQPTDGDQRGPQPAGPALNLHEVFEQMGNPGKPE